MLDFGTVIWNLMRMSRMARFDRKFMIEAHQQLFDVIFHRKACLSFDAIPMKVDSEEFFTCPVFGDILMLAQCFGKMFYVFFTNVLNSKIVNN